MSKLYGVRPSEIIDIQDSYTSYCFDTACAYIISKMKDDEQPNFEIDSENSLAEKPHYNSLSDMYKNMGYVNGSYKKVVE